jgi:NAD+ diphosphatase
MSFTQDFSMPLNVDDNALWFIFNSGRLLTITSGNAHRIPVTADLPKPERWIPDAIPLGKMGERFCYGGHWEDDDPVPAEMALTDLRALFGFLDEPLIWVAGLANQLVFWGRNHRYCGRCGQETEDKTDERAKRCPACGHVYYPRLSPAVIVAVIRDDKILLARNKRFRGPFFSVLAGFVEPGETLEQCVAREVFEEVGIHIGNLRYFGSQPWPFPDSLMVGFTAEYRSGEITANPSEIIEAGWFARDALPKTPPRISIAGRLIEWFTGSVG